MRYLRSVFAVLSILTLFAFIVIGCGSSSSSSSDSLSSTSFAELKSYIDSESSAPENPARVLVHNFINKLT